MTVILKPKDGYEFYATTNRDPFGDHGVVTEIWVHMKGYGLAAFAYGACKSREYAVDIEILDINDYFDAEKCSLIEMIREEQID